MLVALTVVVLVIARYSSSVTLKSTKGIETDEFAQMQLAKLTERIAPIGRVVAGPIKTESPSVSEVAAIKNVASSKGKGEEIYQTACVSCHGAGLMDAPKLGDNTDWGARFPQGFAVVLSNAANGKGSMPPRGGKADLSDADLKSVVIYMLQESGQTVAAEDSGAAQQEEIKMTSADVAPPAAASSGEGKEIYETACVPVMAAVLWTHLN